MPSRADDILRYSFLVALADDGSLDAAELGFIERLALSDSAVDEAEREVLRSLFGRLDPARLTPAVQAEIADFRAHHGI